MDAAEIEHVLSSARLAAYGEGLDLETRILLHVWNSHMAAAMLPSIGALEVALRNRTHAEVGEYFRNEQWMLEGLGSEFAGEYSIIGKRDRYHIGEAARQARERLPEGTVLREHDLIATSSFTLWTSFISRYYAQWLWSDLGQAKRLYRVFPHFPHGTKLDIETVAQDLNQIRRFRNRISHHEPIIKRLDLLEENRRLIYQYLGWISPHLAVLMAGDDRYDEVLEGGRQLLESIADRSP